ncbi:hypothetical protein VB716_11275 [Synechococcus sp. CCY9201]|uniref:hypothetical protein n=1 Tax=unclassified Synechococcus TaxID=2626047 RepID=UPI002B204BA9|nr:MULTISPECIES: hypothetical protein [unclassified Synechococcus]MEA5421853.1 hypothetical protein [Synechococcus sp. CCY9202]MEA5474802.1 hypothetical protein [Synechococcus sp. CCY9201]
MDVLFPILYLIVFAVLLGGSFALMSQGFRRPSPPAAPRHPEAPMPGEPVLYVDLQRERLEALYQEAS